MLTLYGGGPTWVKPCSTTFNSTGSAAPNGGLGSTQAGSPRAPAMSHAVAPSTRRTMPSVVPIGPCLPIVSLSARTVMVGDHNASTAAAYRGGRGPVSQMVTTAPRAARTPSSAGRCRPAVIDSGADQPMDIDVMDG